MAKKDHRSSLPVSEHIYWGADVPMRVIRRFARVVGERFGPDRIILFGSHAYGSPHADSDVDILVVMPARNRHNQAVKIRWEVPAPFPMDLLVRTPQEMTRGLAEGDTFLTEIISKGEALHENGDARVGARSQGCSGLTTAKPSA
jgi:predicted nucleotidyltransferase